MTIKICVVGTTQSGSTRLFNMLRFLYESQHKKVHSCWHYKNENVSSDVIISKIHDCDINYLNNFTFTFLPLRNILDSAISRKKRLPETSLENNCLHNIQLFNKFKDKVNHVVIYEQYSVNQIKKVCSILKIQLDDIQIIAIMKKLDGMFDSLNSKQSKNTRLTKSLLSSSHNTANGNSNKFTTLPESTLKKVLSNSKIKNFLIKYEYF